VFLSLQRESCYKSCCVYNLIFLHNDNINETKQRFAKYNLDKQELAKNCRLEEFLLFNRHPLHISFTTSSQSIQHPFSQSSHLLSLPSYSETKAIGIKFSLSFYFVAKKRREKRMVTMMGWARKLKLAIRTA